eukprot:1160529-Pelagomonas_calceolata.AAC.1
METLEHQEAGHSQKKCFAPAVRACNWAHLNKLVIGFQRMDSIAIYSRRYGRSVPSFPGNVLTTCYWGSSGAVFHRGHMLFINNVLSWNLLRPFDSIKQATQSKMYPDHAIIKQTLPLQNMKP